MNRILKNFCYVPFKELAIMEQNAVSPCCAVYPKDHRKINNLENFDYHNDSYFVDLRNQFLTGNKPDICSKCWKVEETGHTSFRQLWNLKYQGTTFSTDLEFIDIRLSNKCNLQCKMCNKEYSHKIAENELAAINEGLIEASDKHINEISFYKDYNNLSYMEKVFPMIKKNKKTIKGLRLAGGEPMIMPEVMHLIDWLIDEKMFHVNLHILTNLTTINTLLVKKLEKFNKCVVNASVDGVGPYLEYQRFPTSWKTIEKNINKLSKSNITLSLNPCWSQLNILGLYDFIDTMSKYQINHIAFNQVVTPSCLNWDIVPLQYRKDLIKKLNSKNFVLPKNFSESYKKFFSDIEHTYRKMNNNEIIQLQEKIKLWDRNNKISYKEFCPWADEILTNKQKDTIIKI